MTTSTKRRIQVSASAAAVVIVALAAAGIAMRRPPRVVAVEQRPVVQLQAEPTPVTPERPAPQWLDARPLDQLLALARCIERSRGDSVGRAYPRSLTAVERLSCASSSGYDDHHFVRYTPPRGVADKWRARGFTLEVEAAWDSTDEPVKRDIPATRSYLIDASGYIHVTSEHRRATDRDPRLRMCVGSRAEGDECQPYVPRQRWGVRPQLPGVFIAALRDSVRQGKPLEVALDWTPFSGLDRLTSYSIAWSANGKPTLKHLTERQGWPARGRAAVGFRLKHAYSDTGQKVIEVVFTTVDGQRYVQQDTVQVTRR
jgi:hypothetical protein